MAKKPLPKFNIGDTVKCTVIGYTETTLTVSGSKWNGYTYMYSFEEINMRFGEGHLKILTNL